MIHPLHLLDSVPEIKAAEKVFRAIDHPLRKRILRLLDAKKDTTVTDIFVHLRIEQSVASHHLKILRDSKLVETERHGKSIIYKPEYANILKLERIMGEIAATFR